jgi:hypothetical protein
MHSNKTQSSKDVKAHRYKGKENPKDIEKKFK